MRKQYLLLATLIVAVCTTRPLTAIAQESSCEKAPSTAEQYQCANHELSTAEQDLESAFASALQRYTPKADDVKEDSLPPHEKNQQAEYERKMRQRLELSQKIWLQSNQQPAPLCRTSMRAAQWDQQLRLFARLR
jgi:uncharacterized protein YecT (DUF1311 family)